MNETTRKPDGSNSQVALYVAFELGASSWKLALTIGVGQKPRMRTICAGDIAEVCDELSRSKVRFGLPSDCEVRSCYEAGRDGFWLHRCLVEMGVVNVVVDSSSIEVNRRRRRAKTDRLDAVKLVMMLMRYWSDEPKVWSVVRVPSVEDEDRRHLHRELLLLKRERTRHSNRIKGLLMGHGVQVEVGRDFLERLDEECQWDGRALPEALRARLEREHARWEMVRSQIQELELARALEVRESESASVEQVRQLLALRGIGLNSAWLYVMEIFGWRTFQNRRQVGSLIGLTPTPYSSGGDMRECGISKAGNRHVRAMAIEIAWGWLRFQPESALSRWYEARFGGGNSRLRRIGIVALARKLFIALWRYLETGVVPEGAVLKA